MNEIYFVRHGQASFGQPAYDRLSTVGERQAELLGRHFRDTGIRFDAAYSGALRRQVQTATIAMDQMNGESTPKLTIDADFNEMDSSDQMMNRLFTVIKEDPELSEQMKHIHTDHGAIGRIFDVAEKADMMPVQIDTRLKMAQQFRERIGGAIDKLVRKLEDHKKVVVFTSGGPTAVALRRTLDTSREQTVRLGWELRNTSITVLRHHQDQLWLVLFNCVAHLEAQNDPDLITYI
ncbi:histidine phosphatase family protein [Desulfosarcina alkanivorans]|jgi:broad specificity phosphatase PhoE|uniref:Histidine phosphatase family protein n=1 Tax=Desulfosarcina alkanivorans TaxID=571177 RepID=A0A5K7YJB2_9BACT|nr:histidine phosphatase family protein [Desulfosarcina alkanivorans]BBO68485.1 histidine phosphatase family protein [Desulfosarcina alkanivorans]